MKAALQGRIVRFLGRDGRHELFCLHCSWRAKCPGIVPGLEPVTAYANPSEQKVKEYLSKQGLEFTAYKKKALKAHRDKGNRVTACVGDVAPLPRTALSELAKDNVHTAALWLDLLLPEKAHEQLQSATLTEAEREATSAELAKLHAVMLAATHAPFQSIENPVVKLFFHQLVPDKLPTRKVVADLAHGAARDIASELIPFVERHGPFCLVADGATIDSYGFVNVLGMNAWGHVVMLAHADIIHKDSTTETLVHLLRSFVGRSLVAAPG